MSALRLNAKLRGALAALVALASLAGCQGQASPNRLLDPPTAVPAWGTPGPTPTLEPQLPYPISGLPLCKGLKELPGPVLFDWPNVDEARLKLANYNWGYYACDAPVADLKSYIQANMTRPPYLWMDINSAEYKSGVVHAYFQSIQIIWVYVWMLPAGDRQVAFAVVAKGDPLEASAWRSRMRGPVFLGHTGDAELPTAPGKAGQERPT